jgi:capsular polysaccharide biosynthesis protein
VSIDVRTRHSATRPEGALGPYLRAVNAHRWVVFFVTALTLGACGTWLALRTPTYEATAEILVTPLPQSDTTFLGVQVLRESSEPTRTMQTAATLVSSRKAAELTAARLGPTWSTDRVVDAVDVKPQGESNIVAVTARADQSEPAAQVANLYATAALQQRRLDLERQVDAAILQLRAQQRRAGRTGGAAFDIARRLNQLELVKGGIDPTFSSSQAASAPTGPLGPPLWLVVPLALLAGLTLATVAALLLDALVRSPLPPDPFE